MQTAATLVHKGAMDIGIHAVRSFARHFVGTYRLEIHTDGSPDSRDEELLLKAADCMEARIVRPADRRPILAERLASFPARWCRLLRQNGAPDDRRRALFLL
jgi:hypothetical protein